MRTKNSGPFPVTCAGSSYSQPFQPPLKKGKGPCKGKKSRKNVRPNLTGIPTGLASDADRDAVLVESGMEPGPSTSGDASERIEHLNI